MRQYGDNHLLVHDINSMIFSGPQGAPMLSRFGVASIADNVCFKVGKYENNIERFDHNFGAHVDITKVPDKVRKH